MSIKTKILTESEPLDVILSGAEKLYKAVSTTMGPRGNNVIFRKYGKRTGITHDGVTVAKMVKIDDEVEDVGADLLREAAMKLDATTGDGTTTVTVLAYHILKNAVEQIKSGYSPMKLKLELEAIQPEIIKEIEKVTDKDITLEKLISIASVASGSKEIGKSVGEIIFKAGKDTPIILSFSENTETRLEVIDGFKINGGAASPYLMEGAGVKLTINNPKVIITDAKLRDKEDIGPILRLIAGLPQDERDFLLVTSDIAGDALSLLIINRLKGFANIACARVPEYIQSQTEYLSDLAIACGASVLSRNTGHTIKEPSLNDFGSCDKVTVEPRETVIVGGHSIKEDLDERIDSLKEFAKTSKTSAGRKFADDRLKTLEQKIVSIFVGGQSESEAEERHYRFEDAIGACKAALRGGVVAGGGTMLYSLSNDLNGSVAHLVLSGALKMPLIKVLGNAGIDIPENITIGHGIDVMNPNDGVIDLIERGIIDPSESEIECVKTAITIAGLLMTAGAMVVDTGEPEHEKTEF